MMKKFVAVLLALCLVGGAVAMADTTISASGDTAQTTVSYTVDPVNEYVVTIPSEMILQKGETLDGTPSLSGSMVVTLTGEKYNLPNHIYVSVKSANQGYLCLSGMVDVKYPYIMGLNNTSNVLTLSGDAVDILTCDRAQINNGSAATLLVNAEFGDWNAGTYEDTLTFTVKQETIDSDED